MPPPKEEGAGDWYLNRGQQSVVYLPEIRENFIRKRIKHQRNVADWARNESKKMQLGHSNSSPSPSLEEESEYRRQLQEKQLALSKLKYRKLRQQIQETTRDRPKLSTDLLSFSRIPLYSQLEQTTTAPQYSIGSLSPEKLASFSPRRTGYSKHYPMLESTYQHLSPTPYSPYAQYPNNNPYLSPVTAETERYSPTSERQFLSLFSNPAVANQFLMDALLTERALASYKMRFPRRDNVTMQSDQYPKPFIAPTFSL